MTDDHEVAGHPLSLAFIKARQQHFSILLLLALYYEHGYIRSWTPAARHIAAPPTSDVSLCDL